MREYYLHIQLKNKRLHFSINKYEIICDFFIQNGRAFTSQRNLFKVSMTVLLFSPNYIDRLSVSKGGVDQ